MSEMQDVAKRVYDEMNTAMDAALTKAAQSFNADDWDALTHPEHEDNHEWTEEEK